MVARNEVGITLTAKDLASREIGRVGGTLESLAGTAETTGSRLGRVGRIATGVFNGVLLGAGMYAFQALRTGFGFVKEAIFGFNSQMQNAGLAFETMLGSGKKAEQFLKDLKRFAQLTPFEFPDLVTASQRMLAYGFEAKKIIPTLTAVGNAAAGLGGSPEVIDRITRAIGQMKAKGKVSGEEMRQLAETGIPAWDILAKSIGKSTAETMKLVEKGAIPAGQAVDALVAGMGQRFDGLMEKQSHTFSGAMSTIKDITRDVMATAFAPLFGLVAEGADKLSTFLQNNDVTGWAQRFADGLQRVIDNVKGLFGWFANLHATIQDAGVNSIEVGEIIGDLGERLSAFIDGINLDAIAERFLEARERMFETIQNIVSTVLPLLIEGVRQLGEQLPGILSEVVPKVLAFLSTMAEQTMDFVGGLITTFTDNVPAIIDAVTTFFQSAFDWIINEGVPMAAAAIGPLALKFIDWVFEMLPKLLDSLDEIIIAIIGFIAKNGPVLVGKLIEWAIAFVGWIATEVIPRLVKNLPTILRTLLLFLGGAALKLFGKAAEMGAGFVGRILGFIKGLPGAVADFLRSVLARVGDWVRSMIGRAGDAGRDFVGKIAQFFGSLPGKVAGWLGDIVRKVIGWGGDLLRGALKAAGNFVTGFIRGLASLPGRIADAIRSAFRNLRIDIGPFHISASGVRIDLPNIKLPSFAVGAWKLPRDMVAQVHKGEMIVPADIAARLRGESSGSKAMSFTRDSGGGGAGMTVQINNYYGPSSVRSSEDIRRISEEQAERMRLLGSTFTARTAGSIG